MNNSFAHNGYLDSPLGVSRAPGSIGSEPYGYLSFQPRNSDALDWCTQTIRKILPEVEIVLARNWEADDAPTFVQTVSKAAFSIIDCTESVNNYCIELGVAAAIEWRKVLEAFDSTADRRLNPVAMFHGKRLAWTDFGENDTRQLVELIKHLARTTKLGMQRP